MEITITEEDESETEIKAEIIATNKVYIINKKILENNWYWNSNQTNFDVWYINDNYNDEGGSRIENSKAIVIMVKIDTKK